MRDLIAALGFAAVVFAVPACAQTIDTASMTCADLIRLDKQARNSMLGGTEGASSGVSGMEAQQIEALETELHDYCAEYPQASASLALAKVTSE